MKKNTVLLLTALAAFIFIGCSNPGLTPGEVPGTDSSATGTVRFSWSDGEAANRSRANNILDADKVVITIEAADGTVVYNQKQLNLFNFNGSFISEPLSLKVGSYKLTEYLILDSAGTVIFATPKAGSEQAHLVTMPLPHDFTVTKDGTTKVKPQVVDAAAVNPADFGYIGFNFEEAKIFNFMVSVMIYDASADGFVLTDAALDVTTDAKSYSYALTNVTNSLAINDVAGNYTLTLKKAGYEDHRVTYSSAEMKGFFQNPLVIVPVEKEAITFADPNLELYIRRDINKATGKIYKDDVSGITLFNADFAQIKDISGLEHLTSLTSLSLIDNQISDLTPLSTLTSLTRLSLTMNKISDPTPLSTLTNLTALDINHNSLTDISPLASLTKVTNIHLMKNQITDISAISALTELTNITLDTNRISDLTPLANLKKMTRIDLSTNNISDLSPLSSMSNLESIQLSDNTVSDLTPLSTLTKLTYIDLNGNTVSDLTPLSSLTGLSMLKLNNNRITNLLPLSSLTNLHTLYLTRNSITDLTGLVNNSGLKANRTCDLRFNPLSSHAKTVQIPAIQARGAKVHFTN